jgi:hypothetical protein
MLKCEKNEEWYVAIGERKKETATGMMYVALFTALRQGIYM